MKKNGKNEELQSRREFFKRAAKGALPILAGAALLSSPILSETANAMSCAGCNNRCMNSCFNTLKSYIYNSVAELRYTTTYDAKAKQYLQEGKKVVLCPKPNKVKGRKSVFHNHFWNPIMFKWAPTTLGCLIHADQPMFADFITEKHLDWQWWDILTNAKVIDMTDTPQELRPFIQVIDSYETNQKLGIGFEARVNNGKLLVLAVDTRKDLDKRPATQQLLKSIDQYVKSGQFAPRATVKEEFIQSFLIK